MKKPKLWIPLIGILIVVGVVWIILVNGFVLERIRHRINSRSELKIEKIEGSLFAHIKLSGVKLGKVLEISRISVSYSPLSLVRRQIKEVVIEDPRFEMGGSQRSSMVISPFDVKSFVIRNAGVENPAMALDIECSELRGSLQRSQESQTLSITRGKADVVLRGKAIKIDGIEGEVVLDRDFIRISEIRAEVGEGTVNISGLSSFDSLNIRVVASGLAVEGMVENVSGIISSDVSVRRITEKREERPQPKDQQETKDERRKTKGERRDGSQTAPDTMPRFHLSAHGRVTFKEGTYKGQPIGQVRTRVDLVNDSLELKIEEWKLGEMAFTGNALADLSSAPLISYSATLSGEHIDMAVVTSEVPTDMSGTIDIQGKGSEFHSTVDLSGSIKDVLLTSLRAEIDYEPGRVEIVSAKALRGKSEVVASGSVSMNHLKISVSGKDVALDLISPQLSGVSNFDISLKGAPKLPSISGTFYVSAFKFKEMSAKYLSANLNLTKLFPPDGEGEIELANLKVSGNEIETFKASIVTTGEHSTYSIKAHSDSMNLSLEGDGHGENLIVYSLSFASPGIRVSNNGDTRIKFNRTKVKLESCNLLVNESPVQVGGWISRDKVNVTAVAEKCELHAFSEDIDGSVYFTVNINGSLKDPAISLVSEVTDFSYNGISADKIFLAALYRNRTLLIEKAELTKNRGTARVSGKLPVALPFQILDNPMDMEISFSNFGEDIFLPFHRFVEVEKGVLNGNFIIKGSGKHPIIYGNVDFRGKSVAAKFLGTTLTDPIADLNINGDKLTIRNLEAKTPSGFLKVAGNARLPGELDFDIYAKNLPVKTIEDVNATLSLNLSLEGSLENPFVRGKIKVEEAVVTKSFEKKTAVNIETPVDYDLVIDFPDNVRIRSTVSKVAVASVDAEVSGKVEVRKGRDGFLLAGNADVKEGYLYYLHREFKIDRGSFRFTGSPELNPRIDLLASTSISYRSEPDSMDGERSVSVDTIKLRMTGTMSKPEFDLFSEPPIPFEDIVALLSLNMKWEDLLRFQESDYFQTADVLSSLLLREASGRLKSRIGVDALRLETELFSEEKKAQFNIGKYVRDDLYVSYTNDLFSLSKHNFKAEYSPWKYGSVIGETEENKVKTGIQFKIRY
jgi:autotransporter translocation and assembly factor TamB